MRSHWKIVALTLVLTSSPLACLAGETATLRNGFAIHYERRESFGETTRLYLAESTDSFVDVPTSDIIEIEADKVAPAAPQTQATPRPPVHAPIRLDEALSAASRNNHVSPDLLRSVVRVESGFNPNARSPKGATGLMQLMPATAARMGVQDLFNPEQNLDGGARYLRELLGRYNNNLPFALAAYNAGPERVEKYHGIPPFPETIAYVTRVLHNLDVPQPSAARLPIARSASSEFARPSSAPNFEAIRASQAAIAAASQKQSDEDEAQSAEARDSN